MYTGSLKQVPARTSAARPAAKSPALAQLTHPIPASLQDSARSWLAEGQGPERKAKLAAATVFVRDGKQGPEAYMTYRYKSPLGRLAFPGGLAVAQDFDPVPWSNPNAVCWAKAFDREDLGQAQALVVTAVREVFEETGILLASREGEACSLDAASTQKCMVTRQRIASQEKSFSDYLSQRGFKIQADLLKPLARWQSPDFYHKRYDMHYFAAALPVGQSPTLLEGKGVWGGWVPARQVVENPLSLALGDEIDQPDTRGVSFQELVAPGVMCLLRELAASSSSVAFLSKRRQVTLTRSQVEQDASGTCYLTLNPS